MSKLRPLLGTWTTFCSGKPLLASPSSAPGMWRLNFSRTSPNQLSKACVVKTLWFHHVSCETLDFTMFCGPENRHTQLQVSETYNAVPRAYQMLSSFSETALTIHHLKGVMPFNTVRIFKIYLNFIFLPNPDIASYQFPPVNHILKKSGLIAIVALFIST